MFQCLPMTGMWQAVNGLPSGAGIVPIAYHEGQWMALLHCKHTGRKVGHLVDFTGAVEAGDVDSIGAAARECAEETYGFLSPDNLASPEAMELHCKRLAECDGDPRDDPTIQPQIAASMAMLDKQLRSQSNTLCAKSSVCHIFFTEIPFLSVDQLNSACEGLAARHVREFHWVPVEQLHRHSEIEVNGHKLALWPRIRQEEVIDSLVQVTRWEPGSPESPVPPSRREALRWCF